MLDVCKGFNKILNTQRAKKMLAILARSGQFLPICLTFGPSNGPEDFAYATDRVFAPGRRRRMRLCKEWEIYADDATIRTGRMIDGVYYSDSEHSERLHQASKKQNMPEQDLESAFKLLGFNPDGLGNDLKAKAKAKARAKTTKEENAKGKGKEASSDPSPYAHLEVILGLVDHLSTFGGLWYVAAVAFIILLTVILWRRPAVCLGISHGSRPRSHPGLCRYLLFLTLFAAQLGMLTGCDISSCSQVRDRIS